MKTKTTTDSIFLAELNRWIYDGLMREIEPDLVTSTLPILSALYANETEAQKKVRLARYEKAYVTYDALFARCIGTMNQWNKDQRKESLRITEQAAVRDDEVKEATILKKIQSQ